LAKTSFNPANDPIAPGAVPARITEPADDCGGRLEMLTAAACRATLRLIAEAFSSRADRPAATPPPPDICFNLRGRAAGQLRIDADGRCAIRYNPTLLLRYGEDFLKRTVPHEAAHFVAYACHGRGIRPHGPEWQAIMSTFGADPERCHDYDVSGLEARRLRSFVYHCRCGDHQLSSIRHNKVRRGARYYCRRCGDLLRAGPQGEG
jgi:SprT protein